MYVVAALYKFVRLPDYITLRDTLYDYMVANKVKGTLLLAEECINGTICGERAGVDAVKAWLDADGRFAGMSYKESLSDELAFYRTKVKLKKEIVTKRSVLSDISQYDRDFRRYLSDIVQ
jgi:UPF0176 protein